MSLRKAHVLGLALGLTYTAAAFAGSGASAPLATPLRAASQVPGRGGPPPAAPATPAPGTQIFEGTDNDDRATGGPGVDWMFGKKGLDVLQGGGGADRLDGADGDDTMDGGADNDILDGGAGSDTIRGGDGDDTIDGGDDDDLLDGGAGNDDIDGGDGSDALRGGAGNDVLAGGDEDDSLTAGGGNDRLMGNDGADTLDGGAGNDTVLGGEGDDNVAGGPGDDRVDGGRGNDLLHGGLGNDTLLGAAGNDTLHGEDGHDMLTGADGTDALYGGPGDDWLFGGTGADLVLGGDGNDLLVIRAGDVPAGEIDLVNGGGGTDTLILDGFDAVSGGPGASAAWQLVDPITGGVYQIIGVERLEFTELVASLQETGSHPVTIVAVNPAAEPTRARILFFTADGAIAPAAVAGGVPSDDLTFTVPARGSLRLTATVQGPVTAQLFAPTRLAAFVVGSSADVLPALARAPLADTAIVPILEQRSSGASGGVLLVNGATDTTVKLTIHAMDGREMDSGLFVGSKEVTLPAYGHRLVLMRDAFPAMGDFEGAMTIDGGMDRAQEGGPVAVAALSRIGPNGPLSALPAFAMMPRPRSAPVHIAALETGGTAATSLVLINPSSNTRAQGTLRFFDEAGRPWSVSVNRQPGAPTASFDVGGRGSAVFTISAAGLSVQRGSVRAESSEGVVTGFVRTIEKASLTQIPASDVSSSFIAAARRGTGTTTRVSLASTGDPVVLRLSLRTAAGSEVAGGTTEIRLAANGHTTRTIEQLFPQAAIETFDGTISVRAEASPVAATVTEVTGARQFAVPIVSMP